MIRQFNTHRMNQKHNFNVGSTNDLSLRVSVATLVRVLFTNPNNGVRMLALERKATRRETENRHIVELKSQPFGGAIRILDVNKLGDGIGEFHFDSEHSRAEEDFRLFIRPSGWPAVREFCIQHLSHDDDPVLETNPTRELAQEFAEALKVDLMPEQYVCERMGTIVENEPSPTGNFYTKGAPTVRVYRIFEASITDASLAHVLLNTSMNVSDQKLCELALEDAQQGGNGWANAALALPLKRLSDFYFSIPPEARNSSVTFEKNLLDDTVSIILDSITGPKYQRMEEQG